MLSIPLSWNHQISLTDWIIRAIKRSSLMGFGSFTSANGGQTIWIHTFWRAHDALKELLGVEPDDEVEEDVDEWDRKNQVQHFMLWCRYNGDWQKRCMSFIRMDELYSVVIKLAVASALRKMKPQLRQLRISVCCVQSCWIAFRLFTGPFYYANPCIKNVVLIDSAWLRDYILVDMYDYLA